MLDVNTILKTYYESAEEEIYPGFFDTDDVESELIPGYERDCMIYGIYKAKPEYDDLLGGEGYDLVYHIIERRGRQFIGLWVGNRLYDVTEDIARLVDEDSELELMSFDNQDRVAFGKEIYDAYGPDVDPEDLDEYDAECYLAYKRSIGE